MSNPHQFLDDIENPWWMGGQQRPATFLSSLDPAKLGQGVGHAILAVGTGQGADSPESWVHFCVTAATEAYAAIVENPRPDPFIDPRSAFGILLKLSEPERRHELIIEHNGPTSEATLNAAHHAATMAFRLCMPKLVGRRATQAYIACVAAGVQRGYFTGSEAKSLLYTAQLALAAYPSRRAQPARKR